MQSPANTQAIFDALDKKYGYVKPFLFHKTPFQLLIAVILSAQTTDTMVNKVTAELFLKYPTAQDLKLAPIEDVEKLISRINYYRTKAKHIIKTSKMIDEDFEGLVPSSISELIKLPGVGRKVANVIMADIHGIPEGIVVDTHVKRVSKRVGWTKSTDPKKIEQDLMKAWPKERFLNTPKQLIQIGRNYCFPKAPNCKDCPLNKWCEKNI